MTTPYDLCYAFDMEREKTYKELEKEKELAGVVFNERYPKIFGTIKSAWVLGYLKRPPFRGFGKNTLAYKWYRKGLKEG